MRLALTGRLSGPDIPAQLRLLSLAPGQVIVLDERARAVFPPCRLILLRSRSPCPHFSPFAFFPLSTLVLHQQANISTTALAERIAILESALASMSAKSDHANV